MARKLIDVIKAGDKLLFKSGTGFPYLNEYLVLETNINDKVREWKKQTKVRFLSSLDENQVGREMVLNFTAYVEVEDSVFRSTKEARDDDGNVTWRSTGCIEILKGESK